MAISFKPLSEQVIVITGASSGIGLATARAAAAQGAKLVLAARTGSALAEVAQAITQDGGQATHVQADVANRVEVQRIADAAIERFGGFDTWINNAGGSIFGKLEKISEEDHRKLFETNFWGVVNGSLVAAEHLKQRGGTIINLGSVASEMAIPLQGMYCASKHAIKGFTDALRMELEEEGAPISVTLIKPTSINTPFPHHAKNYLDKEPKLPSPIYAPEEVAAAILHSATHQVRDIYVGGSAKVMAAMSRYMPRTMDWISEKVMPGEQVRDESPRNPQGALHEGHSEAQVSGDHPGHVMKRSLYTRAAMHPTFTGILIALGFALLAAGGRSRK